MFGQNCSRPAWHSGQVRSESTMQPTAARSPRLNPVTAEPTFVTRPTISWPGTQGYTVGITSRHSLRTWCRSEWQMPQNRISICTSFSVGSRRGIVADPRGDVALAAEYALALYMSSPSFLALGSVRDFVWGNPLSGQPFSAGAPDS